MTLIMLARVAYLGVVTIQMMKWPNPSTPSLQTGGTHCQARRLDQVTNSVAAIKNFAISMLLRVNLSSSFKQKKNKQYLFHSYVQC